MVRDKSDKITCIRGEGHPCAEDVEGQYGWEELKTAYRTTNPDQPQREKMEWFKTIASDKDRRLLAGNKFMEWDMERGNAQLARLPEWPPTGNSE